MKNPTVFSFGYFQIQKERSRLPEADTSPLLLSDYQRLKNSPLFEKKEGIFNFFLLIFRQFRINYNSSGFPENPFSVPARDPLLRHLGTHIFFNLFKFNSFYPIWDGSGFFNLKHGYLQKKLEVVSSTLIFFRRIRTKKGGKIGCLIFNQKRNILLPG